MTLTFPDRSGGPRMTLLYARELVARKHRVLLAHAGARLDRQNTLLPEFEAAGIQTVLAPELEWPVGPKARRSLSRLARREQVQAIVSCQVRDCAIALNVGAELRIRSIAFAQNLRKFEGNLLKRELKKFWYTRALRRNCDLLICTSPKVTQQHICEFSMSAARVVTISNGIPLGFVGNPQPTLRDQYRSEHGLCADDFVLLSVGRLTPQKGLDLLIEAWAVSELPASCRCLIVGEGQRGGSYPEQLRGLVERLGVSKQFVFAGWRNDVAELMNVADALVHPARWEGGCPPLAVQEALAFGLPTVFTDCAGVPDGFIPGCHGLVIPAENVEALADSLRTLVASSADRLQELATQGRNYAHSHLDGRINASRFADCIEQQLALSGKACV
jgi:glycosyltransferase involved in cell wall biosynthesis